MPSRIKHGLFVSIAIIGLFIASVATSYAETIIYEYDELNRLETVIYQDGRIIQFTYDGAGNRLATYDNTTPPITIADPPGGYYNETKSVILTCIDLSGSGCGTTYYSTDGSTPTVIYSSPINISVTTTLKFFSTDQRGE